LSLRFLYFERLPVGEAYPDGRSNSSVISAVPVVPVVICDYPLFFFLMFGVSLSAFCFACWASLPRLYSGYFWSNSNGRSFPSSMNFLNSSTSFTAFLLFLLWS
jgi:hypothetical protein